MSVDSGPPRRLPFNPSLNRVVLADLPGAPPGVAGTRANAWLVTSSIAERMAQMPELDAAVRQQERDQKPLSDEPGMPSGSSRSPGPLGVAASWPAALDRLLGAPGAPGHAAAKEFADRLGSVLGLLVATITLGPADARAARPEWAPEQWERWAAVRQVALGGGVMRGHLGRCLLAGVHRLLAEVGSPVRVELVADPGGMVIRGAASCVEHGVALDCGGTSMKRVHVRDGVPAERAPDVAPPESSSGDTVALALAQAIAPLVRDSPCAAPVPVSVALATYVDPTGRPYADQLGHYAPLAYLDAPRVIAGLAEELSGRRIDLAIRHDGAAAIAAARLVAPATDAAIVLGTAIGSGMAESASS